MVADAVERGELSASAERSVRSPGARPTAGSSNVAAPRPRLVVVRARRPVVRSSAATCPGKKIKERGPFPRPNVPGVRLFILYLCGLYSGVVRQRWFSPLNWCLLFF